MMSESDQSGNAVRENGPESSPAARKKRVLLVEDDARSRFILLNHLNKAGVEVELAANSALALKKLGEVLFDAIILDLVIHGMKGVDLIKEIRKRKGFADVPILVCTSAVRMKAWGRRGSKAGATRIYDKAATPVETIVAEVVADLNGEITPQSELEPESVDTPQTQTFVLDEPATNNTAHLTSNVSAVP